MVKNAKKLKREMKRLMNKRLAEFDARRASGAFKSRNKPKARRKKGKRLGRSGDGGAVVREYINTLNDPFVHGPVRIGWGTMVPTNLYTATYRASMTANADGSFGVGLLPSLGNTNANIYFNNAGAGVATWTAQKYNNGTAIAAAVNECRIVSGGIKVFPMVPGTGAPGVIYAGSIPSATASDVGAQTLNNLAAVPFLKIGYGATGACAMIHPVDPVSYEFTNLALAGYNAGTLTTSSVPLIVGLGFPASITVFVEAVLNIESVSEFSTTAAITNPELVANDTKTMTDYFPSIEAMWSKIKQYVPESSQVYEAATRIPDVARRARGAYNLYKTARSEYFGAGNPVGNQMLIEELVD